MLLDIGTRKIAQAEMLSTMIARLLERSLGGAGESREKLDCRCGDCGGKIEDVILAGMNPQYAIVSGAGATLRDSVRYPWTSPYTIARGNMLADFRFDVAAESRGRLEVSRLAADPGVGTCSGSSSRATRRTRTSGWQPSRSSSRTAWNGLRCRAVSAGARTAGRSYPSLA